MNIISFLLLIFKTKFLQIIKVSFAIIKGEISYYPNSVKNFEYKFKKKLNINHSLMFSNATSAMEAALFAGGIKNGSIVGTTAFVIPSSYSPVKSLNARLEFYDVDLKTLNFNCDQFLNQTVEISALIVTHFYGNPCDMEVIMDFAKKRNIFVVEDCSHAHGATINGKAVGTFGDVGIFSLQGAKAIAAGEGGIAVSNSSSIMTKMAAYGHQESYKNFKISKVEEPLLPSFGFGKKMRAHPLGAILAYEDFKNLDRKNEIFTSWFNEINDISNKSKIFSLPKKLPSAKIGGFCQGIPLIFEKKEYALVAEDRLRKSKINFFMRDYRDAIKDFTHHQQRDDVLDKLPDTVDAFDRVIFIPFYQFVLYWRWIKLKKVLKFEIL